MAQYCVHCGAQLEDEGAFCHACGKSKARTSSDPGAGAHAVMPPEPEKTFLQQGDVTVTSARFIVPGQTYAMAGVTSVRFARIEPKRGWPLFFALLGFVLLFPSESRALGVILLVVGIIWLFALKATFAVALSSASGEVHAIKSKDSTFVARIVEALNQAIVYRR